MLSGCWGTVRGSWRVEATYSEPAEVIVSAPPPALRAEVDVRPPPPHHDAVWIDGHWKWEGRWVWESGRWERPRSGYVWVGPVAHNRGGRIVYYPGYWHRAGRPRPRHYDEPTTVIVAHRPTGRVIVRPAEPQPEPQARVIVRAPEPEPEPQARVIVRAPEPEPEPRGRVVVRPAEPQPEPQGRVIVRPPQPQPEPEPRGRVVVRPAEPQPEPQGRVIVRPPQPQPEPEPRGRVVVRPPNQPEPQPEPQPGVVGRVGGGGRVEIAPQQPQPGVAGRVGGEGRVGVAPRQPAEPPRANVENPDQGRQVQPPVRGGVRQPAPGNAEAENPNEAPNVRPAPVAAIACRIDTARAPEGGLVGITGAGFGASASVRIGGRVAQVVERGQGRIVVRVPGSAGGGNVRIIEGDRQGDCGVLSVSSR